MEWLGRRSGMECDFRKKVSTPDLERCIEYNDSLNRETTSIKQHLKMKNALKFRIQAYCDESFWHHDLQPIEVQRL